MSPALHTETAGSGLALFLLHGWGLHGGIWDALVPELTSHFRVTRVDLPGHGRSRSSPLSPELEEAARAVLAIAPPEAVWLGWSLGGLLAMRAALDAPSRVRALVLTNATPRFTAAPDWTHAMPPETLAGFAAGLAADYRGTLQRFLSLQVQGDEAARESLRQLRESLYAHGEPDTAALGLGLALLENSDLRSELASIRQPTLVIMGGYDRLTPPRAGEHLTHAIPGARTHLFPGSGHAPFLSHPRQFAAAVVDFVRGLAVKPRAAAGRP
ncbi:MAG TPA: pimeloyl-ACP methyl ester esterase BioH [Gammaproteobacteria bacterium]|nr:pimeloyl-ACP methyl ester esterase BioH [Gammaproteobacteria bacterium]